MCNIFMSTCKDKKMGRLESAAAEEASERGYKMKRFNLIFELEK